MLRQLHQMRSLFILSYTGVSYFVLLKYDTRTGVARGTSTGIKSQTNQAGTWRYLLPAATHEHSSIECSSTIMSTSALRTSIQLWCRLSIDTVHRQPQAALHVRAAPCSYKLISQAHRLSIVRKASQLYAPLPERKKMLSYLYSYEVFDRTPSRDNERKCVVSSVATQSPVPYE